MTIKKVIKKVLKEISKYKSYVIISVVFASVSVGLTLYVPILIGKAIDCLLGQEQVLYDTLIPILVKIAVCVGLTAICQWFMNLCNNKVTFSVTREIRKRAFEHIQKLPLRYVDSHEHGDIVSRMIADIDQFSDGLLLGFTQLFVGSITILGTVLFMLSINVKTTLIVIVLTPVSLFIASYIAKHTFFYFQEQSVRRGEITSYINEMIGSQKLVQAFTFEKESERKFEELNVKLNQASLFAIFYSSTVNPATRFANSLVYIAVGFTGSLGVINGAMTVGQLVSFLSYANQYTKPFNEISGVVTELQNAFTCARRVFELLEEKEEENTGFESKLKKIGNVAVEKVSFGYEKDRLVINDFSLKVKEGEKIAIVGHTGCGKSTLINLLMRFYDIDAGDILFDQRSVYDMKKETVREKIGMVLQDTWLKTGTIAENIAYGNANATIEEIEAAAKKAYVNTFIEKMPLGYDTIIKENGSDLSAGQRQLLCIARVILCNPSMLILDEATSAIDTRTEIYIQKALNSMMKGRTSFIVAHRLSTIQEADQIVVMDNGSIVEKGNHKELLERKSLYYRMYHSQFQNMQE